MKKRLAAGLAGMVVFIMLMQGLNSAHAGSVVPGVAAGEYHTVGLRTDGTVEVAGTNAFRQYDAALWEDIRQIALGASHTVGLKNDGTVVAVGSNGYGQGNVSDWKDIVSVAAGANVTIGIRSDGSLAAAGENGYSQLNVSHWRNMKQVAVGLRHTIGLTTAGTVMATGQNNYRQLEVRNWTDIVQVAAGNDVSIGVKSDGTVVAAGRNELGQADVGKWTDIVQAAAGGTVTLGVKTDGTVVMAGRNTYAENNAERWTDIIQAAVGPDHSVGLKYDGTVVGTGRNYHRQIEVSDWDLGIYEGQNHPGLTRAQVSQLYVAIFGRASEGEGNAYWMADQDDMTIAAQAMLTTTAAEEYFGVTLNDNRSFIEFIYENTLGKTAAQDPDGVDYWVGELAGKKTKGQVVTALINAVTDPVYAGNPAQDQFNNKVAVSDYVAQKIPVIPDGTDVSVFSMFITHVTEDPETVTWAMAEVDGF